VEKAVTFRFRCEGAMSVALAGEFNGWSESAHLMRDNTDRGHWSITVPLAPGRYEYKFLVDGRTWWNDPAAPTVPNVWGSENSYVDVN
jgi:1,4-alpha-glucan branching enzyme